MLAQQAPHFFSDQNTNGTGGRLAAGEKDLEAIELLAVQVRHQERHTVSGNLDRQHASPLRLEGNYVRWPAAVGLSLAQCLDQVGRKQVADDIGDRGSA